MSNNLKIEVMVTNIPESGEIVSEFPTKDYVDGIFARKADLAETGRLPISQMPDYTEMPGLYDYIEDTKESIKGQIATSLQDSKGYTNETLDKRLLVKADLVNGKIPFDQIPFSRDIEEQIEINVENITTVVDQKFGVLTQAINDVLYSANAYTNQELSEFNNNFIEKSQEILSDSKAYVDSTNALNATRGGAYAYDPNIQYVDDAIVWKDEKLQIKDGETWKDVINKIIDTKFVIGRNQITQEVYNDGLESIADLLAIKNPEDKTRITVKSYWPGLSLGGGVFVYSEANEVAYDAGVKFGKWRRQFDTLIPQHFGVIGNFSTKRVSSYFTDLSVAKSRYPTVDALTNILDRVAFNAFLAYVIVNQTRMNWSTQIYLDKPLISYSGALTSNIEGELALKSYDTFLPYCLHVSTSAVVLNGAILIIGTNPSWVDMKSRLIQHGVVFGEVAGLGLTGNATNCDFGTVLASDLLGYAVGWGANCHFSKVRQIRGANCGSAIRNGAYPGLQGVIDTYTVVENIGSDISQATVLAVKETEFLLKIQNLDRYRVTIDGLPYDVINIDGVNKTITIQPGLPQSKQSGGELVYIFGGAVHVDSNNTACTAFSTLQAIVCGYGFNVPALYGPKIGVFVTEFCGIAIGISYRNSTSLGSTVDLGYFEGNTVDVLYGWSLDSHSSLKINHTIAFDPLKTFNMFAYTVGETRRRDWSRMGSGSIDWNGKTLKLDGDMYNINLTTHNDFQLVGGAGGVNLRFDHKIAEMTGIYSKKIDFLAQDPNNSLLTFYPPVGFTVNGAPTYTLRVQDYEGIVSATFYVQEDYASEIKNINVFVNGKRKVLKGTSAQRPTNAFVGLQYFDTTLAAAGKPIYYTGTGWVDATGTPV